MIPCQRDLFDLPEDVAYLNCAYMSPLLRAVVAAGQAAAARKARPWQIAPSDFFQDMERARGLFARLIGAAPACIAIIPAASYGAALAARNLAVAPGQRIVLLAEQFPSHVYAWQELARQRGAQVVRVPRPEQGGWTTALVPAITPETAVVAVPHCHWTDGSLVDLPAVGARCAEVGAALAVDLTQSAGALPFDVSDVRPDFAFAACYKWLLGPYSVGFLYADPKYHGGEPLEHNWIARAGSEDFARLVDYRDDFQPGARRFDVGEAANFALLPMACAALEQLLAWGVPEIAASLRAKTDAIAAAAADVGLVASDAHLRAGHFLGLRRPGGLPQDLLPRLQERGVHVSVRGDSLRVTPHLYNNEADVARLLEALQAIL